MRTTLLALSSLMLAACAAQPRIDHGKALLQDRLFVLPETLPEARQGNALSPAMQAFIDQGAGSGSRRNSRIDWLSDVLTRDGELALRYDASATRSAAQAFDAKAGNCLSLALMVGAFANKLDIPFHYQLVYVNDTWSRSGDLTLASTHVNVALGTESSGGRPPGEASRQRVIDFLPAEELLGQRAQEIRESTVLAMYMNNRAVELMVQARIDEAYAWVRGAILEDPSFLSSYNTLGVIYRRHRNLPEAERAFRYALALEPENTSVMSNLAQTLADLGQSEESRRLTARLAQIDPTPPFYFFDRGIAAMQKGEYAVAKALFTREIRRAAYNHEFHFWLAMADLGLGEPDKARKHLGIALENSTNLREHALYAAKLDWLNRHGMN